MTHIRNGTEYLDAQEMRVYRAVDHLVRVGRSGNTSQVAAEARIGRTTVSNVLYHLAARRFLTDISDCAAHYWRLTNQPAFIDPELAGPHEVVPLPGSEHGSHRARCGYCGEPVFRLTWPGTRSQDAPWQHATLGTVPGRCALGDHSLCLVPNPDTGCPGFTPDEDLARYLPCRGPGGCGAQPGRPCTTTDLRIMAGIHEARRRLLSDGGEVRMGTRWTTERVIKYGLAVKDNLENGSNPPSPDEWDDAERDKGE